VNENQENPMTASEATAVRKAITHYLGRYGVTEAEFARFIDVSDDRLSGFRSGALASLNESERVKLGDVMKDFIVAEDADAEIEKYYRRPHTQTVRDVLAAK
jgi:hypothetical protein